MTDNFRSSHYQIWSICNMSSIFNGFFRIAIVLAAIAASSYLPDAAHAQYPCGNGPGPGEVVVGQTPGSQAHAPILLCQYVGGDEKQGEDSESTPSRPPYEGKPGFMAAAYHADTSSAWLTTGHQSMASAKKHALDSCNLATRGGCSIAVAYDSYGSINVSVDAMGQLWIKLEPFVRRQPNAPRYDVMQDNPAINYCRQNSFGCEFAGSKPNGTMPMEPDPNSSYVADYFPPGPLTRNHWALVARPTNTPSAAWQNKSWLISGRQDSVATRNEILDRCRADAGVTCSISAYAVTDNPLGGPKVGGQLVHFVDSTGQDHWTNAVPARAKTRHKRRAKNESQTREDAITAPDRVNIACPSAVKPCRVIATYDAATPRLQVVQGAR